MSGIGCPTREELVGYALGGIPEADGEAISRHLEGCESCEAALSEVEGSADRLIDLCRQPAPLDRYSQEAACHDAVTRAIALGSGFAEATDDTPADTTAEPVEEAEPVLGQMGDYKLVEELSHGGMGTVYRAIHVRLGREVALKVLPKGRHTDQRAVARFEREMAAVGKLDHPHIVRATDAGEVEGVQYLAMELIDGFDLTELVDYLGPLGVADSCLVIHHAALGLQQAYEQGLVHRDIKPSNVMVTSGGVAKILDLGLARFHIDKQSNVELTTAGQPMGTADYMAPEQVADTHSVDIRADIYSLGCTFYKILAGQPPFGGVQYSSSFDKMMAHRKETPPPIQEFRPDLPKKVVAVLEQMLAKDPDDRFQKPSDLAEYLYPLCAGANLPEMIENAWKATETAPTPLSTGEATPNGEEGPSSSSTTPRRKRPVNMGSTGGSSTQGQSRSQYSGFYVMPPPPKPQWGLWITIGVLSSLLMGILGAYWAAEYIGRKNDSTLGPNLVATPSGWRVLLDQDPVSVPVAEPLNLGSGKPPRVRGALGEEALVAEPYEIDGLASWTLETAGHRTPILCAAVAPDAKALATGSGEGAIRIWDLDDGDLTSILIYPDRDGAVRALAWAPTGSYLAAAYQAGTLLIWDVERGTVLPRDFATRSAEPDSLAWSPDGTILAYIDKSLGQETDDAVMLWDFKANKGLQPLTGAQGRLNTLAFSPDGLKLAAGGEDLSVHIWEVATSGEIISFSAHTEPITALAWSPCATMIASSCGGGESYQGVIVWSLDGLELGSLNKHPGGDSALVWLADPPLIIGTGGGRDGRTRYYDLDRGTLGPDLDTGTSLLCRVGTKDQAILIKENGDVRSCDPTGLGQRSLAELPLLSGTPSALAVSSNGQMIACGTEDNKILLVDAINGEADPLSADGSVRSLAFSPDANPDEAELAVTTEAWNPSRRELRSTMAVYNVKKRRFLWSSGDEPVIDLAWSPEGKEIASVGDRVIIWDHESGDELRDFDLRSFDGEVEAVTWMQGGTALALGSDSTIEVVEAEDGSSLLSVDDMTDLPRLLAWSQVAGRLAVTGGSDGAPEMILLAADPSVSEDSFPVRSHDQPILTLGWQADGKAVLTGSRSETCGWDVNTKERNSKSALGCQAFSADGTLAVMGGPSVIRLHRPQTRGLLRTVLTFKDHNYAVISPEGHHDASWKASDIRYVVQTDEDQATLDEEQFADQYGWENDRDKVAAVQE